MNGPAKEPRGYYVPFRPGETNRCPGCGRSHWHVGRLQAECGFCGTALDLLAETARGAGPVRLIFNRPAVPGPTEEN